MEGEYCNLPDNLRSDRPVKRKNVVSTAHFHCHDFSQLLRTRVTCAIQYLHFSDIMSLWTRLPAM